MEPVSAHAPGRVELLGNHTDYNEGYVLSAAIDRGITLHGRRRDDDVIELRSSEMGRSFSIRLGELKRTEEEFWANYALGVVDCLVGAGFKLGGFSAEISSTLPLGAGLSSSAALEVSTATLLKKMFSLEIDRLTLAKLCRRAENEFVGVNCGLLDQVSSAFGKRDHAILLDCRNETVETIPFPAGVELLIAHSGVKHALVGGEYNERREQCFDAAKRLGVPALRDTTMARLQAARAGMPELSFRRALHIVGENERVQQGVACLRSGDAESFGRLMFASHESSRKNFENSTPELDALVEIAAAEAGVLGARLTGGGFGGATVSLIQRDRGEEISTHFIEKYRARTGYQCQTYLCEIADGAE
jgi:galactokinase